ncbi:MAG: hypothetical protein MUD14_20395 [Hydrococcus sp. Prado102]|nr:hypothetical protein [Hydrococcus sp. Prado102]
MQGKNNGKIEISDLIVDAVYNAVARRNWDLETEEMAVLLEEEVGAIKGGLKIKRADLLEEEIAAVRGGQTSGAGIIVKYPPIVAGGIPIPQPEVM